MIFGIQEPKIVYNGISYLLDHCTGDYNFNNNTIITNKDLFTGTSYNTAIGAYMEFNLTINLFKYADIKAKYLEIISFTTKDFWFMPHRDGSVVLGIDNTPALFRITDVKLDKFQEQYDTLTIKISSLKYVKV